MWGFLPATLLTLWGSLGQAAVVDTLIDDIGSEGFVSDLTTALLRVAMILGMVALCVYGLKGVYRRVRRPDNPEALVSGRLRGALSRWSVL